MKITPLVCLLTLAACFAVRAEEKPAEAGKDAKDHGAKEHNEKGAVHLSPEAVKLADLELQPASAGTIYTMLEAPGEIALNGDRVAHLSPKAPGTVLKVLKVAGDKIGEGDVLAQIESAELGNAKIEYFTATLNLNMARAELERETLIHGNTQQLLDALKEDLEPEDLEKRVGGLELGEIKSKALAGHSALRLAHVSWTRAQKLKDDQIISAAALEASAKELQNAKAEYLGVREELKLNYKGRLLQSQRALSIAETAAQNARRRLHILGLSNEQIAALQSEKEENVALLDLRAPFAGTVLEKNIALGERAEESKDAFLIADLSTVWLNVRINANDLSSVHAGQAVQVSIPGIAGERAAKVALLSPLVDEKTRTASARIVLENKDGALLPGAFVTASLVLNELKAAVTVPSAAIQNIEGKSVVFIEGDEAGEFRSQEILVGAADGKLVEVKAGLEAGKKVVVRNSFTLKAELGKGAGED